MSFGTKGHQQCGGLDGGGLTGHDHVEGGLRLVDTQVVSLGDFGDQLE